MSPAPEPAANGMRLRQGSGSDLRLSPPFFGIAPPPGGGALGFRAIASRRRGYADEVRCSLTLLHLHLDVPRPGVLRLRHP